MAVSTRMAAPNYKIFEPDTLDAIYAQKMFDPIYGGFAGAMGIAHKMDSAGNAEQALAAQDRFNTMASNLDKLEMTEKTKQEGMKQAGHLAGLGESPDLLTGGGDIYTDPTKSLLPGLLRGKIQAQTAAELAKASADRAAGKESETYQEQYNTVGGERTGGSTVTRTFKGKPGGTAISGSGATNPPQIDPKGSTPTPNNPTAPVVNQQQVQARAKAAAGPDAVMRGQNPDGSTLWAGSKGAYAFDGNGKMYRHDPVAKKFVPAE